MSLAPGTRLGPYEIVSILGAGGMGEVCRARDTRLDRTVAVKALPAEKLPDEERKRRFLAEARAVSALNHPNIVSIHDLATANGADFLVLEYVPGKALEDAIPKKGLRLNEALRYAIQIADALAAAHAADIVHRDLKPGNVMVTPNGTVKLLDFGLAKLMERDAWRSGDATGMVATVEGTIAGTVSYMSPEQAEAKPLDARSDIFSFGSVLYEMLTGQRAFQGDSPMATSHSNQSMTMVKLFFSRRTATERSGRCLPPVGLNPRFSRTCYSGTSCPPRTAFTSRSALSKGIPFRSSTSRLGRCGHSARRHGRPPTV